MITREEQYLNRLAGETDQAIPEPETRKEQYLSRLCGADNIIPQEPITREEQYLASLCGEEVEMPEPETRLEQYMAFAGGERENKPEPITRKEQLWDKYQGGGVIEDKTVTGEIISVSDAVEAPAVKLKVTIEPKQEGSGDPSPENIRPITGWTGAEVNINSDTQTTLFNRTVYGGTVDLVTGELVVTWASDDLSTASFTSIQSSGVYAFRTSAQNIKQITSTEISTLKSNILKTISSRGGFYDNEFGIARSTDNTDFLYIILNQELTTISALQNWLTENKFKMVYELKTPQTYTLTPQQIQMLEGNNTVWVELINEDTTTQIATIELTYKSRAAQRVLAMNRKLATNKAQLEIKRNGGVIIDKPIIKPIGGGAKL